MSPSKTAKHGAELCRHRLQCERCQELEQEVEALGQQLHSSEARLAKAAAEVAAAGGGALQARAAALEAELAAAAAARGAAEAARAAADEELVRLKAEVGGLRRQVADASQVDAADLQRRLKDVTDMLYLKQVCLWVCECVGGLCGTGASRRARVFASRRPPALTSPPPHHLPPGQTQLERLAADKAAQQLSLERELTQAKQEAQSVKRRTTLERPTSAGDAEGVVPLDSLGGAYHKLATNRRVGGAVRAGAEFVDSSASQVGRLRRRWGGAAARDERVRPLTCLGVRPPPFATPSLSWCACCGTTRWDGCWRLPTCWACTSSFTSSSTDCSAAPLPSTSARSRQTRSPATSASEHAAAGHFCLF